METLIHSVYIYCIIQGCPGGKVEPKVTVSLIFQRFQGQLRRSLLEQKTSPGMWDPTSGYRNSLHLWVLVATFMQYKYPYANEAYWRDKCPYHCLIRGQVSSVGQAYVSCVDLIILPPVLGVLPRKPFR